MKRVIYGRKAKFRKILIGRILPESECSHHHFEFINIHIVLNLTCIMIWPLKILKMTSFLIRNRSRNERHAKIEKFGIQFWLEPTSHSSNHLKTRQAGNLDLQFFSLSSCCAFSASLCACGPRVPPSLRRRRSRPTKFDLCIFDDFFFSLPIRFILPLMKCRETSLVATCKIFQKFQPIRDR